jgi:hypothetical protein
MFKIGDLVRVTFEEGAADKIGIFVEDDTYAIGYDKDGWPIITRARVRWDGEVCSTPLDQIESIPVLDG